MNSKFESLGLHQAILKALREMDHLNPTPVQSQVIPPMLEGRDIIAQARTGTGKTAAFALPALHNLDGGSKKTQVLILTPTRELAKQVGKAIEDYARYSECSVLTIYGGASYSYQKSALKKGAQIVIGTPGRLLDLEKQGNLKLAELKVLVMDEADEMLSMGFAEELETLVSKLPVDRQTALFSATMPKEIEKLAKASTRNAHRVNLSGELSVKSVSLSYFLVRESDKVAAVTRLFEGENITTALIFCRTRAQTNVLAAKLTSFGIPAEALSGAMSQEAREMTLKRFRKATFSVLVATDVAARGLDIDHLSHVINMDLPQSPETFVHRIGRVGRAGRSGRALSLVTPREEWKLKRIERAIKRRIDPGKIPTKKSIKRGRLENLYVKLGKWLESDRCKSELSHVDELRAAGYDARNIAAAALKLASASLKERPIADMADEEPSTKSGGKKKSKKPKGKVVALSAKIGKKQGLKVKEMVHLLQKIAQVPPHDVGKIHISKSRCFVEVPSQYVKPILRQNGKYKIGRHKFAFAAED